jgi:hypothetical protein
LRVNATDADGTISKVQFEANSQVLNVDMTAPFEFEWPNVPAGTYHIIARATDNGGRMDTDAIDITVGELSCAGTGKIYREIWTGIPGTSISSIPVTATPTRIVEMTNFSTPNYVGNDYGSRIRGYLCVPVNGSYKFFIASDDNSELWLSTDENPANKVRIAYLNGSSPLNGWGKYPSTISQSIQLLGGHRYYIEVLHKEGNGADHVSVAWQFQNGDFEGPIPGNRLIPYSNPATTAANFGDPEVVTGSQESSGVYPNPVKRNSELTILSPDGAGQGQVQLMSATGSTLQEQRVTFDALGASRLQLNDRVIPGIYFIKVLSNRRQRVLKIKVE